MDGGWEGGTVDFDWVGTQIIMTGKGMAAGS